MQKDLLIKPKSQFKDEIEDRINLGNELFKENISNHNELSSLTDRYNVWYEYNLELLKQSFDIPENEYYKDYKYRREFVGSITMGHIPTLQEKLNDQREEIKNQLNKLNIIREKIPLMKIDDKLSRSNNITIVDSINILENLFKKFHRIAQTLRNRYDNRPTLIIKDEYDVQDLLRSILKEHFDDVRDEDYVPSYAGSNSRIDFVLKTEKIVIETKMTNEKLKDREVGNQLLIDIGRYKNHQDCDTLILFIYDKGDFILNKNGLITDLNKMSTDTLNVKTFINPY